VAYTDPEVAWVGLNEDQAKAQGIKVKKCLFPWTASGRAIANGRDESFTKLLFSWFYRGDKCCDAGDNLREHKMPRVTKVFQTFNFDQTLPMVSPRIQFASIAKGGN
jgi:hypothetical protein